jgi:hypothetical protein
MLGQKRIADRKSPVMNGNGINLMAFSVWMQLQEKNI